MEEHLVDVTQSIARCFTVLEQVATMGSGGLLREIAAAVGLPKSTVHRLLGDLTALGYVRQDGESGRYRLTGRMFEVGSAGFGGQDLITAARPYLDELAQEVEETVHLVVRDGADAVYVYKAEAGHLRLSSRLGLRVPMYCTGVGKAILSTLPREEAGAILRAAPLRAITPSTIVVPDMLERQFGVIRERGWALDDEENELGIRCVAAALPGPTGVAEVAFSISTPSARMDDDRVEDLAKRCLAVRAGILGKKP